MVGIGRKLLAGALFAGVALPAHGALYVRGGGTMVYDDVLDVTWAADAGPSFANADAARAYADNLVLGGFDDWRLPRAFNPGTADICEGYNCTLSEMGYMHYVNFGAAAMVATFNGSNAANIALFVNTGSTNRWVYEEDFTDANRGSYLPFDCVITPGLESCTWGFRNDGIQSYGGKDQPFNAWAVRNGDVDALEPVPEPASWAMMIGGFALAGGHMRRRARQGLRFA